MEEIFLNFTKIEWWFNGLFFAFIASIIPFIYSRVIVYLGENIIKKPIRRRKAKLLKRVKKIRGDDIKINYEISEKHSIFDSIYIKCSYLYCLLRNSLNFSCFSCKRCFRYRLLILKCVVIRVFPNFYS